MSVPRNRGDDGRTGTAAGRRRDLSWLDPSRTHHHVLAHAIATVVLLAALAALTVALLAAPSQPRRPLRESHITSARASPVQRRARQAVQSRAVARRERVWLVTIYMRYATHDEPIGAALE